tara:strand:+ start:157 stop:270 length:114 start_codon:yes stop_codon:yes gene_type:complete
MNVSQEAATKAAEEIKYFILKQRERCERLKKRLKTSK